MDPSYTAEMLRRYQIPKIRLTDRAEISTALLHQFLNGRRRMSPETAARVEAALGSLVRERRRVLLKEQICEMVIDTLEAG